MAPGDKATLARHLRTALEYGSIRDLSDGQLLERFTTTDSLELRELAFTVLVERHGPMVLRACRGILGGSSDVDDAFQATFLVLVRRASSLWVRESIAPWLHQVAHRSALAARTASRRRQRLERLTPSQTQTVPEVETARVVHEEVARLSDRDRAVVVLCDLEGKSYEQAARALGWPVGSVKSRLSRARDRLRLRLIRRGMAPETAASSALVALRGSIPPVATPLIHLTSKLACGFATGRTLLLPTSATLLAEGVLHAMNLSRGLTLASASMLTLLGLVASLAWASPQEPPPKPTAAISPAIDQAPPAAIPTAVATAVTKPQMVTSRGTVAPQDGVWIFNTSHRSLTLITSVSTGTKVKAGDILYRFDPEPIQTDLDNAEEKVKEDSQKVQEAEQKVSDVQSRYDQQNNVVVTLSRTTHDNAVTAAVQKTQRTERRIKRYQEAVEQVAKIILSPNDPGQVGITVARLNLLDRLEEAELVLETDEKVLAKVRAEPMVPDVESNSRLKELLSEKEEATQQFALLKVQLSKSQRIVTDLRDELTRCQIRSPADGTFFRYSSQSSDLLVGMQVKMGTSLGHVITANEEKPKLLLMDLKFPSNTSLRTGQEGVIKYMNRPISQAISFHERSFAVRYVEHRIRQDNYHDLMRGSSVTNLSIYAFDVDSSSMMPKPGTPIEFSFASVVPTGMVEIPLAALDVSKKRVAVRGVDRSFRWREVELAGDSPPVGKVVLKNMLVEGEVVALDPYAAMGEAPTTNPLIKGENTRPISPRRP